MVRRLSYAAGGMVCVTLAGVSAQAATPQNPQPAPADAKRYVVFGCVSRATPAANNSAAASPKFLITDARGDKPVAYRLDGDESTLTFHVGHTVEVSGPLSTAPSSTGGPNALVLKVNSLTYLSLTCKSTK